MCGVYDELMIAHLKRYELVVNLLLALVWAIFAYRQIGAFVATGNWAFALFCISESLQAFFFAFRSRAKDVTVKPFAWAVAIGGTLAALSFTPGGWVLWQGGPALLVFGVLLQISSTLSLNRSFAIVASLRTVKTMGMYRIVRHPLYASYTISLLGYLLFNATILNLFCFIATLIYFYFRIEEEEKLLSKDEIYKAYRQRVKFRLLPLIY